MNNTTLAELKQLQIAHTDEGDFLFYKGRPENEFYVKAIVKKKLAGLLILDVEDEEFSIAAKRGFAPGQVVKALLVAQIQDSKVTFTIRSIETV